MGRTTSSRETIRWIGISIFGLALSACFPFVSLERDPDGILNSLDIVAEREVGKVTYFVAQDGPRFAKLVQVRHGRVGMLYVVDTRARRCLADKEIPCADLRADPDVGRYITWSP